MSNDTFDVDGTLDAIASDGMAESLRILQDHTLEQIAQDPALALRAHAVLTATVRRLRVEIGRLRAQNEQLRGTVRLLRDERDQLRAVN